jgi:nucleoside-diphosphate kinase
MTERTLILVKPDGVRRGLVGEIITRVERKGLKILGLKMIKFTPELARRHYEEHVNKPFYRDLEEFILSGPVIAFVVEGESVVAMTRKLIGSTRRPEAFPGSIRGDFASSTRENLIHGSDSPERAEVEIANFFTAGELVG